MRRETGAGPPRPVRVAAVGLGWVCVHRHLAVMDRLAEFDVVGVIDRHPGRAKTVAEQRGYHNYATTGQLADAPWITDVDAVTISAPPMAHADLIGQALALGKHVLTEKPFTMNVKEGQAVADDAQRRGLCVGIVHNFQFARSMKRLMADLHDGRLGRLTGVNAVQLGNPMRRLPAWYDTLPFGLFYDESPHLLYLLRCLAGNIKLSRVLTTPHRNGGNTPGTVDAFFICPSGITVTLRCNFDSPVSEWHVFAYGEDGVGIVDVFRDIYLFLPNDGSHGTREVIRTSLAATAQHWWQHVVSGIPHLTGRLTYGNDEVFSRFADAIRGDKEVLGPIGLPDALAVLELQHQIIEQAESAFWT